jgi:hypothetical protein
VCGAFARNPCGVAQGGRLAPRVGTLPPPLTVLAQAMGAGRQRSFKRLEENAGGVPEEEFPVSDVTREHGVRGVAGLLPDLK